MGFFLFILEFVFWHGDIPLTMEWFCYLNGVRYGWEVLIINLFDFILFYYMTIITSTYEDLGSRVQLMIILYLPEVEISLLQGSY